MQIRDLVSPNPEVDFVNDVQLGWYPADPKNRALARNYMFTNTAPEGYRSSLELLSVMRDAFINGSENRFVITATYGHGKTHFALALANFFGQPAGSPEVEGLLKQIGYASTHSKAQGLHDFKANRSPYLVIRLRGDKAPSLPEQFLSGLETALGEHSQTRAEKLPLWFDSAERFLAGLSPDQAKHAEEFLAGRSQDLANLRSAIQNKRGDVFDLCRDLSRYLYGTPLDFGSEISLEQAVMQACDSYCGDGKPFSGLLILFDEFSTFIQKYAERRGGTASLQDLLDGVGNRRDRAVFIAFSQHDPDQVADNVYRASSDTDKRDSLGKELTRLPIPQRSKLYSSLETVIKAYLNQEPALWSELYDRAVAALEEATDKTMLLFERLYEERLGWGTERVSEIITQGCFPLHPVTTAMLCSVELRQVTNPRAVLGFVLEALKDRLDQSALLGNRPNWVYAVDLVDWFGEMLSEKEWEQYSAVRQRLSGNIIDGQSQVLKAMLLQSVRQLKTKGIGYAGVICLLSGLGRDQCETILRDLSDGGYILRDPAGGLETFSFWTAGASGDKLDREVNQRLAPTFDVNAINAVWQQTDRLAPLPIEVSWGHAKDYSASQYLVARATFTPAWIKKIVTSFHVDARVGFSEASRGFLLWLVAETEEDLDWFREHAKSVLDEGLPGDHPPPVVLALPTEARPSLTRYILRERAYSELPTEIKHEYGQEVLRDADRRYRLSVDGELTRLKLKPDFEVPAPYRAVVGVSGTVTDYKKCLEICYRAAYRQAPQAFFIQYPTANSNLSKAVWQMSRYLAENRIAASQDLQDTLAPARDLMRNYLRQGSSTSWGMVTQDNAIQAPANARIRQAWDFLDKKFMAGKSPVAIQSALLPLLQAPFGYDYNHALLVLSAWYGFNRTSLKMQDGASTTALSDLLRNPGKPRDLIMTLCGQGMTLLRRDKNAVFQEIGALVEEINNPTQFSRINAKNKISSLNTLMREEKLGDLHESVLAAIERLDDGLTRADEYTKAATDVKQKIQSAPAVSSLVQIYRSLDKLPTLGCVAASEVPTPTTLRQSLLERLRDVVTVQTKKYSALSDLTAYGLHKTALTSIRTDLKSLGIPDLDDQVESGLTTLDERRAALEDRQRDSAIVAEVRSIPNQGSLKQGRDSIVQLQALKPHTSEATHLIAEKVTVLQKEITAHEHFVQELPARLDHSTRLAEVSQLQQEIQRRYNNFLQTPELTEIEAAAHRCHTLEEMLKSLTLLQQSRVQSPQDKQQTLLKIGTLQQQSETYLSPQQANIFQVLRDEIAAQAAARLNEAQTWLLGCTRQAQDGQNLSAVLSRLSAPPPFLPQSQLQEANALKTQVQQQLDQDEVASITDRFRRITDPAIRQACLQALEQIVRGLEPV